MTDRITVLHLIDHLGAGGAQEVVLNLARSLDRGRWDTRVWCLHGRGQYYDELRSLGAEVRSLSTWKANPLIPVRLLLGLRRQRCDILHLHLSFSTLAGGLAAWLAGVPRVVVTLHALKNQSLPWVFPMWAFLSALYDKFVAQVDMSARELRAVGIPPSKIAVIRLGTEMEPDSESEAVPLTQWLNAADEGPILLNIARLHKHKGQIHLIRAMARVVREIPSARLLVVGDGPMKQALGGEIAKLGLDKSVLLLGFRRDLRALYSASTLFVLPSTQEGMGVVTIQALAHGLPVVASDVGAVSEAVKPGETGLLVPPGDPKALAEAILVLLSDAGQRHRLGQQGQAHAREWFGLRKMVEGYEDLYGALQSREAAA